MYSVKYSFPTGLSGKCYEGKGPVVTSGGSWGKILQDSFNGAFSTPSIRFWNNTPGQTIEVIEKK